VSIQKQDKMFLQRYYRERRGDKFIPNPSNMVGGNLEAE
jgi:hypothetical protein